MSGIYGTVKPANITKDDVDIFYSFRETRTSKDANGGYVRLDSSILQNAEIADDAAKIPGIYNLKLPVENFKDKGFYNIYIRPREVGNIHIETIGTLATYSDVRGVVFKSEDIGEFISPNALVGYRIDYFNEAGDRESFTRIITSSHPCEPLAQSSINGTSIRFRYSSEGTHIFCTVTPSVESSFKPDTFPNIGSNGQTVALINTKFNPVMIELEIVEHDIETISTMLEGEQIRDIDHGLITYLNEDRSIYRQYEYKALKTETGNPAYDVKTRKLSPDTIQDMNTILGV